MRRLVGCLDVNEFFVHVTYKFAADSQIHQPRVPI